MRRIDREQRQMGDLIGVEHDAERAMRSRP